MKQLVKLWERPSYDGNGFTYYLLYTDENGKRKQKSLGHSDKRKAERQRAQFERKLRMGKVESGSLKLKDFVKDSLTRTGDQIRESTQIGYERTMKDFIDTIGNISYRDVKPTHGEYFRQVCIDRDESPATVAKKLREIKRFFGLAVQRRQLDENPLQYVKPPKVPKQKIRVYNADEARLLLRSASEFQNEDILEWDLLITLALTTGMRKGELLNLIWNDIDFEAMTIEVSPKKNTDYTWEWLIKDTDRRELPLTKNVLQMLADHQTQQPEGYPYVFIPPARYDHIQQLRKQGKWSLRDARLKVVNNFSRKFDKILKMASVRKRKFHCLRNTALTNWFANGMSEHDVMTLAGHSSFSTTHEFYLAVADDLVDRARVAAEQSVDKNLAHIWHAPHFLPTIKKADSHNQLSANNLSNGQGRT